MGDPEAGAQRLRPAGCAVLAAYAILLALVVPFHEPWADEAQAWLLAHDLSVPQLLFHALRHEAHPALWYLLLWGPTHLHVPYALFNWFSAALATAGVYVLLRYAPFPFYLRALLPFTFFLAYQYAVVARSYVLFPLLGFAVAHLYRARQPRPVRIAVALALLANLSVHGTIVALVFAALYAGKLRDGSSPAPVPRRQIQSAAGIFAASIVLVLVCLWPAQAGLPLLGPTLNRMIDRLSLHAATPPAPQTPAAPPSTPLSQLPAVTAAPAPGAASVPGRDRLANIRTVSTYAFASSALLAILFHLVTFIYLYRARKLRLALPAVALGLFLVFVYSAPWHFGLLWVTVLMVLWAAWDPAVPLTRPAWQNAVAVFLALLCVLQLPWTIAAVRFDRQQATSPDKATAAYLRTLPANTRIAGLGMATGVQPYFAHNIFVNQKTTFGYLGRDRPAPTAARALALHPDVLVADAFQAPTVAASGYQAAATFCGTLFFPNRPLQPTCLTVFRLPETSPVPQP